MLLLGIETSTRQVRCASRTEDGLLGSAWSCRRPRRRAAAPPRRTLTPAIEYCCAQLGVTLAHVSAIAVGIGPGHVHRPARRRDHGEDPCPGAAGPDDPDPEPRPASRIRCAHARVLVVPAIDARRNELYYALYRTVPGGVQRASDYEVARPRRPRGRARSARRGVAVVRRRRPAVRECARRREAPSSPGRHTRRRAWPALAELAIATRYRTRRLLRAPDDVLPMYLRKSDAELDGTGRADDEATPRHDRDR